MAGNDDSNQDTPESSSRRRRNGGVSGTLMRQILDRDERKDTTVIDALRAESRQKTWIIVGLMVLLGMIFAGVLGVGVTGHVPGVGELTIVSQEDPGEVVEEVP